MFSSLGLMEQWVWAESLEFEAHLIHFFLALWPWVSSMPPFHSLKIYSLQRERPGFNPWVGKIPWRRKCQSTPVLLPGKSHGQRSLVGYSPWGRKESDTTERLYLTPYYGEGNGNPLQCSCLENPRDGGARWAAICGVAQSRTWLKRLSSSSSNQLPPVLPRWC